MILYEMSHSNENVEQNQELLKISAVLSCLIAIWIIGIVSGPICNKKKFL